MMHCGILKKAGDNEEMMSLHQEKKGIGHVVVVELVQTRAVAQSSDNWIASVG